MQINISIKKLGHAVGTVGWLAEQAAQIVIAKTKDGSQGAWLKDKDGNTITVLAIRGYWDNGDKIDIATRPQAWGGDFCANVSFTDAAWVIVEQLQAIAVTAMEETEHVELAAGFQVTVAR